MFTRPNRITDTMRFGGVYTLMDATVFFGVLLYGWNYIAEWVYPPLRFWFRLFLSCVSIFWMLPSPLKPGQKNITTLIDLLRKDMTTYCPDTIYSSQQQAFEENRRIGESEE
ncbi:hypothetical protein NGG16_03025 [Enterococcus casseliflavus]|uniref:DUF5592 family protein n=1 Tax=Enterococcus casseliflavus TaxID=37734 RepID=UPI002DBBDD9C|nr:hypothetical protein [Enterococcus casseliflavus]MEB8416407.1 hypothetical protein [Enterococcus casseliflavus]